MCGFAGFLDPSFDRVRGEHLLRNMGKAILHRGPDDEGCWHDARIGIGVVHRRLSILDLSQNGHQPMISENGRYVIAYNGELYNYRDLQKELEQTAISFRGGSDTEVLLAAISEWGVHAALRKTVGMFAFALWDRSKNTLILARDRMGEKPLYYGRQGTSFLFGSELKALRVHPSFKGEIDRNSICLLLRHNTIAAPFSIYTEIKKLEPGCMLELDTNTAKISISGYWSVRSAAEAGMQNRLLKNDKDMLVSLESVLSRSVSEQMMADVPVGAFLSGGIDSSLIVALMQAQSNQAVNTFSIGFHESGYDEACHAKVIARHLGTKHTELYVEEPEVLDVIPKLPKIYDEPFSDSSQIPTYLVSMMARQQVTVALSGDGGDELFGGYNRYVWSCAIWNKIRFMPYPVRKLVANLMRGISVAGYERLFKLLSAFIPDRYMVSHPGIMMHKLGKTIESDSLKSIYQNLVSHWQVPDNVVLDCVEPETKVSDDSKWLSTNDFEHQMMYMDQVSYLPDDILTKVDRAAMATSLELRVPMLDHRVVEFSWKLPVAAKIRGGKGKWLLRQLLDKYVPRELNERPKMGFGVPINIWLRGPLREWGEELLDESRLKREGYFDPKPVRKKWDEHLSGKQDWQYHLWDILMFQSWLEEQKT